MLFAWFLKLLLRNARDAYYKMIFAALNSTLENMASGSTYISNNRKVHRGTRSLGKGIVSGRGKREYRGQAAIFVWDSSILWAPPIKRPRARGSLEILRLVHSVYISRKFPRKSALTSAIIMGLGKWFSLYGFSLSLSLWNKMWKKETGIFYKITSNML